MRRAGMIACTVMATLAVAVCVLPGTSEARRWTPREYAYQYTVEITCGTNPDSFARVVPGDYTMVVNVMNLGNDARVRARAVLSYPTSTRSDWLRSEFRSGQARQLSCGSLRDGLLEFADPIDDAAFLQGFLIITSKQPLNVIARYTASGQGEVSSEVVAAEGKRMFVPADLLRGGVEICHVPPGNPGNEHTITIDQSAVPAHLAHGDYKGECDSDTVYDED
jgi:hypothetical protein